MDDTGATRDDLKVPEGDVGDECNNATAEGRDIMVSYLWCLGTWQKFLIFCQNKMVFKSNYQNSTK